MAHDAPLTTPPRGGTSAAVARSARRQWMPSGFRVAAAVLVPIALAFNAVLMMSDRAPRIVGAYVSWAAARLDPHGRIERALEAVLPEGELLVHVAVWWMAALLVGLAVASWRGLAAAMGLLFAASVAVEYGQGLFTATRSVEQADLVANTVGIGLGATTVAMLHVLTVGLATVRADRRQVARTSNSS